MAVISLQHKYLFIQTPRTACTAIAQGVLIPKCDGMTYPPATVLDKRGQILMDQKHCTLGQLFLYNIVTPNELEPFLKFSTIRNPFDSIASEYVKQRHTYASMLEQPTTWVHRFPGYAEDMRFAADHSFTEWVDRKWRRRFPRSVIRGRRNAAAGESGWQDGVDFVMRYERLQTDFDDALARIGFEPIAIPRLNETAERGTDYRQYYTPTAQSIIEDVYADILSRYGYTF